MQEHKRVKHGEQPGDIGRWRKIQMRESKKPFWIFPWHQIGENAIKAFRKVLVAKGRTVQRRRDKAEIERGLDIGGDDD